MMALVSAVVVVVFGGATLFLQNETFIKLKPTIIYLLFTATLFGGLVFRKPLLAMVFDQVFHLTEEGWRKLTMRWALFFLALAVLNEIVWRTQSTDTWVTFKVFGVMPLTFIFAAFQYPLLMKHDASPKEPDDASPRRIRRSRKAAPDIAVSRSSEHGFVSARPPSVRRMADALRSPRRHGPGLSRRSSCGDFISIIFRPKNERWLCESILACLLSIAPRMLLLGAAFKLSSPGSGSVALISDPWPRGLFSAVAAERPDLKECAVRDLKVLTALGEHGEAQDIPGDDIAAAFFTLVKARAACAAGNTTEALAIYDSISLVSGRSAKK